MSMNDVIIILCIAIAVWWPIGGFINRRRGQAWLDWLNAGVKELGETGSVKWLRSFRSVGQYTIINPRAPFQMIDILFTLENRDNLILWGFRHFRGRRDEMIIQANLRGVPEQDLEIGAPGRKSYDTYLKVQKDQPFTELPEAGGFRIAKRGEEDPATITRLRAFLAGTGKVILRMSVQSQLQANPKIWSPREAKHLLLRVAMTKMDHQSPATFFAALREWANGIAVANADQAESPWLSSD